jgi:hypothetical protein
MISISSNLLPFQSSFIVENESHTVQGQEKMEVATPVGFRVWLRNVAQAEPSVVVHCHDGFAHPLTTTFLIACSILSCRDATELVSNIPHLLFDLLEQTQNHNTVLIEENCEQLLSCFELGQHSLAVGTKVNFTPMTGFLFQDTATDPRFITSDNVS